MKRGINMNLRYKLMQFMSGRYGADSLFYVLFAISAILAFINCFARSLVLQLIVYIVITYAIFRMMSRNINARVREKMAFEKIFVKIKEKWHIRRQRKADYNHVYKKCPRCHAVLRLPRRKGKHTTVCPKCSKEFKVHVFKA